AQRCLWASTSTKNPAYRDVLYVEQLIGPDTVNTMPPQTIVAFQDHGEVARTLDGEDIGVAEDCMRQLEEAGISMVQVTAQLEVEGVALFADSYNKLISGAEDKAKRLQAEMHSGAESGGQPSKDVSPRPMPAASAAPNLTSRQTASIGTLQQQVDAALQRAEAERFAKRIWGKDPTLWKPNPSEQ